MRNKKSMFSAIPLAGLALLYAVLCMAAPLSWAAKNMDIKDALILVRPGNLPDAERSAAAVLVEELAKRTGITLKTATRWPDNKPVIAITSAREVKAWSHDIPGLLGGNGKDGFRLFVDKHGSGAPIVWVIGADPRGALYGVGALLRNLVWEKGQAALPGALDIATAPVSPIRGHQIGFRTQANSWDAWTVAEYDQHIRELAFFGVNSIENIPFHDDRIAPVMKVPRREMNKQMSVICARYGLDYWVWTPADFDLKDTKLRNEMLARHKELYRDCPELTGVFFPGGDPGDNTPELVFPFLEDLSKLLLASHPKAKIWLSLQGFNEKQTDYALDYLAKNNLPWLGGLCEGPSSPPIATLRNRLPKHYGLRGYPDITHNKICQYPVPWWDQAYALTLGREAINPRPVQYAYIHNWFAPYTDGFISYSDGVHDDVNKAIWSAMSWNPNTPVRDVLADYARVFFGPAMADQAADGILALEKNWLGPLVDNGAVDATLLLWQGLEKQAPELEGNWRWQMCLVRAYYDAYVRARLINETNLEHQANNVLLEADKLGAGKAMAEAAKMLDKADKAPVAVALRARVVDLYAKLFHSIGLQTSVEKYFASGAERGASLDFIDIPLNNRWWLEDRFKAIAGLADEAEKCRQLKQIATWEHPGPGSFYDDIGNTANSPHIKRSEVNYANPAEGANPEPLLWWLDNGKCRQRLSWQTTMDWPDAAIYEGLDPDATYTVRTSGYGNEQLKIDGVSVKPFNNGKEIGAFKDYSVPSELLKDRKVEVTWNKLAGEAGVPWREQSRIAEIWLLKL